MFKVKNRFKWRKLFEWWILSILFFLISFKTESDTRKEKKNNSLEIVLRDVLRSVRTDDEYEQKSNKTLQ